MKVLYLDPIAGISGDMFLGLLLDLGVELAAVETELHRLPIGGWQLQNFREKRQGIATTRLKVNAPEEHHHRTWLQIDRMLLDSDLEPAAKECARRIFRRIGVAEAAVHGMALEQVHFHEVGALDSIIDIVGAAVALQLLGVDGVRCAPLPLSHGFVVTAHGNFPLPAPATVEILRGCPVRDGHCDQELVTPTGAAIAAEIATFGALPAMTIERVGYGAGERQLTDRPNLLRGIVGYLDSDASAQDRVAVLESHLDDANPEWLGALLERLLAAGALDVGYTPLQMKKNRPGLRLTVVAPPAAAPSLARLLLRESSASGVRCHETLRYKLQRRQEIIATPLGPAQVKLFFEDGTLLRVTPEFDSCQRLAQESGRPLPEIYRLVERAADVLFDHPASPKSKT